MASNRSTVSHLLLAAAVALCATAPLAAPRDEPWAGRPLVDALERLRGEGLRLVYSNELVPRRLTVLAEPVSVLPRRILDELLAPYGLTVSEGPGGTLLVVRGAAPEPGRLLGRVRGEGSDDPPTARVVVVGGNLSARADAGGNYALSLPPGRYALSVSAPGFITRPIDGVVVLPGTDTRLDVRVSPLEIVHETIRVSADERIEAGPTEELIGLDRETLDLAPSLVDDPYEVVGRLPGVTASETTAGLNVRGGRGDELLVLLDGLEIQDPYHVKDLGGGLISAFDSTTIGSIDYLGGAFPAQYGNRTSGVLEMTTTTATTPSEGTLTLTNGLFRASGRGTLGGDRGEWLVSGRAGDPEFLVSNFVDKSIYKPEYYDVLAKASWRLGSRTTLAGHLLLSIDSSEQHGSIDDDDDEPETGLARSRYGNAFAWLTADTVWSAGLWSRTLLAWGAAEVDRSVLDVVDVAIQDDRDYNFAELKQDWRAVPHERHHLRWGFGVRWEEADYRYESDLDSPGGPAAPWNIETRPSGVGYSLYFSETFRAHRSLLLEFGLRHDGETYTGLDDSVTSPRFNLAWSIGADTTLRAGWGRYHQFQRPYELQVADGDATFYPVETSEHRQVNLERRCSTHVTARVGIYEKSQHGVRPWHENLLDPFSLAPEAQPDRVRVVPDRALARGVELALQGETDFGLDWFASYAYANADDTVDGGEEPRLWDQQHTVELGLIYLVNHRWELGLTGNWHSGRPTTAVVGRLAGDPEDEPQVVTELGPRNGERYPAYSRVDARAARRFRLGATGLEVFTNVTNLLDRENVCCTSGFDFTIEPDDTVTVVPVEREGYDWTISAGVTWTF